MSATVPTFRGCHVGDSEATPHSRSLVLPSSCDTRHPSQAVPRLRGWGSRSECPDLYGLNGGIEETDLSSVHKGTLNSDILDIKGYLAHHGPVRLDRQNEFLTL